jgi:class 3 adenylate cyclase
VPTVPAHILYMDIIGSALLPTASQRAAYDDLNLLVSSTSEYCRAAAMGTVLCRPVGDGMALVFFAGVESPLCCAMEVAALIAQRPTFPKLRMGVHSGEVARVLDINGNPDVTGDGIVTAQRVMSCGDAGHILVSSTVVDGVSGRPGWPEMLKYVGVAEVKHGRKVALWSLATAEVGNPKLPALLAAQIASETLRHAGGGGDSAWTRLLTPGHLAIALLLVMAPTGVGWALMIFTNLGPPQAGAALVGLLLGGGYLAWQYRRLR